MDLVTRTRCGAHSPIAHKRKVGSFSGRCVSKQLPLVSAPSLVRKYLVLPEARTCGFHEGVDWQFWGGARRAAVRPSSLKATCPFSQCCAPRGALP